MFKVKLVIKSKEVIEDAHKAIFNLDGIQFQTGDGLVDFEEGVDLFIDFEECDKTFEGNICKMELSMPEIMVDGEPDDDLSDDESLLVGVLESCKLTEIIFYPQYCELELIKVTILVDDWYERELDLSGCMLL